MTSHDNINPFSTNDLFLLSLKSSVNLRFPYNFSGYRSGTLVENKLIETILENVGELPGKHSLKLYILLRTKTFRDVF